MYKYEFTHKPIHANMYTYIQINKHKMNTHMYKHTSKEKGNKECEEERNRNYSKQN